VHALGQSKMFIAFYYGNERVKLARYRSTYIMTGWALFDFTILLETIAPVFKFYSSYGQYGQCYKIYRFSLTTGYVMSQTEMTHSANKQSESLLCAFTP
jgi:hypothetical protein